MNSAILTLCHSDVNGKWKITSETVAVSKKLGSDNSLSRALSKRVTSVSPIS